MPSQPNFFTKTKHENKAATAVKFPSDLFVSQVRKAVY